MPQTHNPARTVAVGDNHGQRLDNFLLARLRDIPKSRIYRLIRTGQVRVNGTRRKPHYRLNESDQVRIPPLWRAPTDDALPPPLVLPVLYEDEDILVLDKPAGLAVHGGSGVRFGVIERLRGGGVADGDGGVVDGDGGGVDGADSDGGGDDGDGGDDDGDGGDDDGDGGDDDGDGGDDDGDGGDGDGGGDDGDGDGDTNLQLAHRLDRDTSGCLLLARNRAALLALHRQFRGDDTPPGKFYIALVSGELRQPRTVTTAIAGRPAESTLRPLCIFAGCTLVDIRLRTGRTHQARAHAAAAGHPIAGDPRYGDRNFNRHLRPTGLRRLFLHAHRLQITHPRTGRSLNLESPLPGELGEVLGRL